MKWIILLFCSLIVFQEALAQHQLSGTVIDNNGQSLPFSTVLLLNESEELVKGAVSDAAGVFNLTNVSSGNYILRITAVGYDDFSQSIRVLEQIKLEPIVLRESTEILDEVTVTAKKPVYVQQPDRTIVNVASLPSASGGNALELIEKSPSVQIDRVSSNISLLGRDGVAIAINGKLNRLEGNDLLQFLSSLPSDNIESIELINNPPASYDAEGKGGVINIVIKEYEEDGFNGGINVFTGYGQRGKYGGSMVFNYRQGATNIYGDASVSQDYTNQDSDILSSINFDNGFLGTDQRSSRPAFLGNSSAKLGINQRISKSTSIDVFGSFARRRWELEAETETFYEGVISDADRDLLTGSETNTTNQYTISSFLQHKLSNGNIISGSYDFLSFDIDNPTNYNLTNFDSESTVISEELFRSGKQTPFTFNVFRLDYNGSITESINFEAGSKVTLSSVENNTQLLDEAGNEVQDDLFTNEIDLDEEIYAAYLSFNGSLGDHYSFIAGVRYEFSDLVLTSGLGDVDREISRFFPSVSVTRKFTDDTQFTLAYRERIDRPGFQNLTPAFFFLNAFTVLTGNIQALPSISRVLETTLNHKSLAVSLSYSREDDPVIQYAQPVIDQERNLLLLISDNINQRNQVGLNVSFPIEITDFWSSRYSIGGFWREDQVNLDGVVVNESNPFFTANVAQSFNLDQGWSAEVSGFWNSVIYQGTIRQPSRVSVSLGIQKEFKNLSKLSFSWTDMFDTGTFLEFVNDLPNQGIFYDWNYDFEGNIFRLTYSMPLGNQLSKKSRDSGATDVLKRAEN